jgi:hypothetical protein
VVQVVALLAAVVVAGVLVRTGARARDGVANENAL